MLYLFHGTDVEKTRAKAFEWVAKAREKEPNLVYARLSREELSSEALAEASASGGLFVKRLLVLVDDPFPARAKTNEAAEDDTEPARANLIEERLSELADSDNAFVILAPKLPAAKAKKLSAKAKMTYAFDLPAKREPARGFNSALVNALAAKNRQALWLEVERALAAGDAPEMVHGLLHWKARDLMEKGSRSWPREESRALSMRLIALVMDARRKGLDLGRELERFALSV